MSVEISNDKLFISHLRKAVKYLRTDEGTDLEETARVLNKFADLKQGYMDLAEAEHEKLVSSNRNASNVSYTTEGRKYSWSDYKMDAAEEAERESN